MPKAEVGSTKYIANKMKAKGLQRLRWYCQICQKQCRDENGFKQHTMSEGHVRSMLLVGEDPKKFINDYSNQFKRDFLQLLKTAHGEKKVHMNNFYQEYIRDKEHVHMNSTKWPSLTEFAKYLGREGVCRVEEGERGLEIQWIDDSPDAVARREDVKKKDRQAKGDEDLESRLLAQQIRRAKEAEKAGKPEEDRPKEIVDADRVEPVKLSLSLGAKAASKAVVPQQKEDQADGPVAIETFSVDARVSEPAKPQEETDAYSTRPPAPAKISLSGLSAKPKSNPFMKKSNPLSKRQEYAVAEPEKKMSNAERIMKEELVRKRQREERGFTGVGKKPRLQY